MARFVWCTYRWNWCGGGTTMTRLAAILTEGNVKQGKVCGIDYSEERVGRKQASKRALNR